MSAISVASILLSCVALIWSLRTLRGVRLEQEEKVKVTMLGGDFSALSPAERLQRFRDVARKAGIDLQGDDS